MTDPVMKAHRGEARKVLATWSGGIDSTALLALLLRAGFRVTALSFYLYDGAMGDRERLARMRLLPLLSGLGSLTAIEDRGVSPSGASWLSAFNTPDGECPTRNRRILDHLLARYGHAYADFAMGEYIGADRWLVRDHVAAKDADARALASYLYSEYGLGFRLWTLADFGEATYKADRLAMGFLALGEQGMALTTNCMRGTIDHCGSCYKCVERAAAFSCLGAKDGTAYREDPRANPAFPSYVAQMEGKGGSVPASAFGLHAAGDGLGSGSGA